MGNEVVSAGFNPVSLMPSSFDAKLKMAQTLVKSGMLPQGLNTAEKVCVALEWGHELQLSPMVAVNNIAVINGKPTLSADLMGALVKRSPEYGGIEWKCLTDEKAECVITRILPNGKEEKYTSTFTMEDAKIAGLATKDVWRKYPKRMLKHRCMSYGLRDVFPDLLAGIYETEEAESITYKEPTESELRNVTPEPEITGIEPNSGEPIENTDDVTPPAQVADDRKKLKDIIEKYEPQLNVNNVNGNPYEMACEALAENNPENISTVLARIIPYLGYKGIQVA